MSNNEFECKGFSEGQVPFAPVAAVVLDVDSCLCGIEGLEEMAGWRGMEGEVCVLTERAMNGELAWEDGFRRRLDMLRPTPEDLERLAFCYLDNLTPHAREVISALAFCGIQAFFVSGGIDASIYPIADALGVSRSNVFANSLVFNNGRYHGYYEGTPLAKGRKAPVVQMLRETGRVVGRLAGVGDGMMDLQAVSGGLKVGFGGWVERPGVRGGSDIYLSCRSVAPLLPLALGPYFPAIRAKYPDLEEIFAVGLQGLSDAHFNAPAHGIRQALERQLSS